MKMRIFITLFVALVALAALPSTASADIITVNGVGPTGIFGPISITGSTPIPTTLAFGTVGLDTFNFTLSSGGNPALTLLSGVVLADNGVCNNLTLASNCVGLFVSVTAGDPGQITSVINLSVDQTFAPPPGFVSAIIPVSEALIGNCNTVAGNVSFTPQFNSTSPFAALSATCAGTNSFNLTNSTTTAGGPIPIDINNQITFNLIGGSIMIPAGSCTGSSTCVVPTLPSTTAPEPSSLVLLGSGMIGLVGLAKRRI